MGTVILCRGRVANKPYRIGQTGIRIYTVEELCYYIYNNIYLIGSDFVDDKLIDFIREETFDDALAERLKELKEKNAGLAEMVVTILKSVDYYTIGEIEQIREILNTLNSQNIYERLKSRGDSLLSNHCYYAAIDCYLQILQEYKGNDLSGAFLSKVYHNLGVSFAKMFLYEEAEEAFLCSYKIGQHEESRKCALAARLLAMQHNEPENDDTSEEEYVLKREIETLMDNARYSDEYRELEEMDSLKNDGRVNEYNKMADSFLSKWKKDYRKYIGA